MPKDDPNNYPHRNFVADTGYVEYLLKTLAEYEAKSHPNNGELSAEGKDLTALRALRLAGKLVEHVAGWAIDHQVGLALRGLKFVPLQPSGTKNHHEYLEERAVVNSHEHEHAGGQWRPSPSQELDPVMARRLLRSLLHANSGGFPDGLVLEAVRQLEGLDFGEPGPMFEPVETDAKVKLGELRLQLEAVCFVEYRVKKGFKKLKAKQEVADALGVAELTLRAWEYRLRQALGELAVARAISFARNSASYSDGTDVESARDADKQYGADALQSLAARYKAAKIARKQTPDTKT